MPKNANRGGSRGTRSSGRPTKKERREEIRQARIEAQRRRTKARRRRLFMIWALVAVVVLGGGALGVTRIVESRHTLKSALAEAGCSKLEKFEAQAAQHIDIQPPPARVPYNTDPPTSGQHNGSSIAPWGSHTETIVPETFVHNLEHGGIVVHYKDLSTADVRALEDLADSYSDGVIVMPNESIDHKLVLTQWAHMQTCKKYSEKVVVGFITDRCNKAVPEPVSRCVRT